MAELGSDGGVCSGFVLAWRDRGEVMQRSTNAGERGRAVASHSFVARIGLHWSATMRTSDADSDAAEPD